MFNCWSHKHVKLKRYRETSPSKIVCSVKFGSKYKDFSLDIDDNDRAWPRVPADSKFTKKYSGKRGSDLKKTNSIGISVYQNINFL